MEVKESGGAGPNVSTELAHERTDLALERTRMASERTLMAWIRTSLSMISFGFTVVKFFQYLTESGQRQATFQGVRNFGLTLICLGTLILIPAAYQNRQLLKQLGSLDDKPAVSLALLVAIAVGILGILAFGSAVFRWFF